MANNSVMLTTEEGNSPIGGMIGKPPIERDMDMSEAGEACGAAGERSGKTTRRSCIAASKQRERNKNGKRLMNETSEPVSILLDRRSRIERTARQQARDVSQLHQIIDRMARMLEAHVAREEVQWRGMKESL
jgi:hypothetical protein